MKNKFFHKVKPEAAGNLPVFKDSGAAFGKICLQKPILPYGKGPKGRFFHITYSAMHKKCSRLPATVNAWNAECA